MRRVASLLVRDGEGRVLLVSKDRKEWHLPGGVKKKREPYLKALRREVWEELRLRIKRVSKKRIRAVHPSRARIPTRYVIFAAKKKNLKGTPRLNPNDPIKYFGWFEFTRHMRVNPCTRAVLSSL